MQSVSPELDAPQVRVAEHQKQYNPVTVALVADRRFPIVEHALGEFNGVVMAFRPSDAERAQIAAGDDIYVSLLTFGKPQQAIMVTAGKEAMAGYYCVGAGLPEREGAELASVQASTMDTATPVGGI